MSRPKKPAADRRTEVLHVRATVTETDAAYRLARRQSITLTELFHRYLQRLIADEAAHRRHSVVQKLFAPLNGRRLVTVSLPVIH